MTATLFYKVWDNSAAPSPPWQIGWIIQQIFEMSWFYMGIAQIALEPPPLCQTDKYRKKSAPNHPGKPSKEAIIFKKINSGKKF